MQRALAKILSKREKGTSVLHDSVMVSKDQIMKGVAHHIKKFEFHPEDTGK